MKKNEAKKAIVEILKEKQEPLNKTVLFREIQAAVDCEIGEFTFRQALKELNIAEKVLIESGKGNARLCSLPNAAQQQFGLNKPKEERSLIG